LKVSGDVSFNAEMFVKSDASFNASISVGQNVSVSGLLEQWNE